MPAAMRRVRFDALVPVFLVGLSSCVVPTGVGTGSSPGSSRGEVAVSSPSPPPSPLASATPTPAPPPPSLDDPAGVATELVTVEEAIRDTATQAAELPTLGRRQQEAYRRLTSHPEWIPTVLSAVGPDTAHIVQANVRAAQELILLNEPVRALPKWRIVAPPAADDLLAYYREADQRFGVPWPYLAAIHLIETSMSRIQGTSSAGALGPMQFMPATWAAYGQGDVNNPHDAILAAGRYLRAAGAPGNMARALYAYNHSDRYVRAVSLYAEQMKADDRAFFGYYYWRVYVSTTKGDVLLEEGFSG